jgi:hypothetical protein
VADARDMTRLCACVAMDAERCLMVRYKIDPADYNRDFDGVCECVCHWAEDAEAEDWSE